MARPSCIGARTHRGARNDCATGGAGGILRAVHLKLRNASYRTPSLLLTGLNASTFLRVNQDEILLPKLSA